MRICFSLKVVPDQPAGGGAHFTAKFADYLSSQGHSIEYFFRSENPPDLIFFFDHKRYSDRVIHKWLGLDEAREIKRSFPELPVITRINDIGAPKDRPADFVERFVELANLSDHVIFISNWLREIYYKGLVASPSTVIKQGVDETVFKIKPYTPILPDNIKLFTHHWSPSKIKGWDIYQRIDEWIEDSGIAFTFVGNMPKGIKLRNTTTLAPLVGRDLAEEISKHDIYVTASEYEPAGMHQLEGLACGLPYLYSAKGGGLREAGNYGIEFDDFRDFKAKLQTIVDRHAELFSKIQSSFDFYNKYSFPKYERVIENVLAES